MTVAISKEDLRAVVSDVIRETMDEIVRRDRPRILALVTVSSVLIACAVAIPVTLTLTGENTKTNCRLIQQLAQLGTRSLTKERLEIRRFERESRDRLGLSQGRFEELVNAQQTEAEHRQVVLEGIERHNCGG